jgi:molybdopterin-guanine dinucleotide biosynthesis protein A
VADLGRLTGILLLGGASRRFGSPKALARLNGRTLAEIGWETLGVACEERIAVGKLDDGLDLPFPILDDGVDARAPIAGVVAGLRAARNRSCVVLPVDTPLVGAVHLWMLASALGWRTAAAVPETGPLPAAFRKRALGVLERRLVSGELALKAAVAELRARTVSIPQGLLRNLNTREELRALEQQLRAPAAEEGSLRAEFYLYFPSRPSADAAAGALVADGYGAEVGPSAGSDQWLVLARGQLAEADDLEEIEERLAQLAARLGGEYDGNAVDLG